MITKQNENYKWVVLFISFILMLTFAISLQSLPPIFDKIVEDIAFTNSQAGLLMGIYAIPGIILPFLVAFLTSKYNEKSMILISLLILISGLIAFSLSKTFNILLASRLISGIGATILVVLAPLLITMFFDDKNMGIAMGVFNAAVPFGTVISANLFGVLGEKIYWRSIILGIAAFVGIVFIISSFLLNIPRKKEIDASESDSVESSKGLFSNMSLIALSIIWMLGNFQLLSYVTFAPQHFQSIGMSVQKAGFLTSFVMLVPIFLSPIIGIIVDKTGWKKRLILIGSIIMGLSFILISKEVAGLSLWAFTLGLGFAPIPVIVFSLLPDLILSKQMGMGLGIITVASNVGIAGGPSAFGFLLDKTGENFNIGFMTLALLSLVIILSLGVLNKRIE